MFGQTFDAHDIATVLLLVVLEGILSIDNALVLGLLARRLPKRLQGRALTYGLVGAFVFRLLAIATAMYLLRWRSVKLLGGGYLLYVAVKHFFESKRTAAGRPDRPERNAEAREPGMVARLMGLMRSPTVRMQFWSAVAVIELTDIAFAVDSILAAIALVGAPPAQHPKDAAHPKLWVVLLGGMLGVVLMRFAAVLFIRLLEKFPRFETAAYLLVGVIGLKLLADFGFNSIEHPHRVDFHQPSSVAFWLFWISMLVCFLIGFIPRRQTPIEAGRLTEL